MTRSYMTKPDRIAQIRAEAERIRETEGEKAVTVRNISRRLRISRYLVHKYCGRQRDLLK